MGRLLDEVSDCLPEAVSPISALKNELLARMVANVIFIAEKALNCHILHRIPYGMTARHVLKN